jgi:hypothetical protein
MYSSVANYWVISLTRLLVNDGFCEDVVHLSKNNEEQFIINKVNIAPIDTNMLHKMDIFIIIIIHNTRAK